MARLDAYLPTLNTGMMDVRVQDAILNYPIVRSLLVPECDLEARRRCINLITRVLNAATPVLPLILQEQTHLNGQGGRPAIPVLSLEAQAKVMTIISTMADRDRLIRFWMHHHVNNKGTMVSAGADKKSQLPATIALYTKIKQYKEILSDLADRIQGAICIVFWECWDEIYPTLGDIVGGEEMERTDTGRIFRPSGEAAIYINKLKVERKRRLEQERRESIISQVGAASMPISMPSGRSDRSASVSSFPVASQFDGSRNSAGQEDDSPASLATDHSVSSSWAPGYRAPDLQLIDTSELNFIMEESHAAEQRAASDTLDAFTNINSSLEGHKQVPHEMLDLRKRIQMMEEGYAPEHPAHVQANSMEGIIW